MIDKSANKYETILYPKKTLLVFNKEISLVNPSKTSKFVVNTVILNKPFSKLLNDLVGLNTNDHTFVLNENEIFNLNLNFKANESSRFLIEDNKITINMILIWLKYEPFSYYHQLLNKKLQSEFSGKLKD